MRSVRGSSVCVCGGKRKFPLSRSKSPPHGCIYPFVSPPSCLSRFLAAPVASGRPSLAQFTQPCPIRQPPQRPYSLSSILTQFRTAVRSTLRVVRPSANDGARYVNRPVPMTAPSWFASRWRLFVLKGRPVFYFLVVCVKREQCRSRKDLEGKKALAALNARAL